MKQIFYSSFVVLMTLYCVRIVSAYPDTRVDNLVPGWHASGRISYAWCKARDFELDYLEHVLDPRGACLLIRITAIMIKDGQHIRAKDYVSSGTAYATFEIVTWPSGEKPFCVRRVGTQCSSKFTFFEPDLISSVANIIFS